MTRTARDMDRDGLTAYLGGFPVTEEQADAMLEADGRQWRRP